MDTAQEWNILEIWLMQYPSFPTTGEPCRYRDGTWLAKSECPFVRLSKGSDTLFLFLWLSWQCARRWFDEGDINHLVNLGKYVSAMLAAGTKLAYENDNSAGWLSLVVIVSSVATIYQLYWDFVKDWGLLQFNSKNPWLRNDLILKQKYIYFLSMVCSLKTLRFTSNLFEKIKIVWCTYRE